MSTEPKSSVKLQRLLSISDSDMAAAAQQLMQLSDEDNNSISSSSSNSHSNSNDNSDKKLFRSKMMINSKRLFEQSQEEITSAMIEKIFGKEEEILRPNYKKRRYRFLESIYKETKPIY
ncbi:hypothetical protein PTKIN_Ptkin08bG0160600 [Pterospermum kingtungense]